MGHNEGMQAVGPALPVCSQCGNPSAGSTFSDGEVYFCPRCLAIDNEIREVMAAIDVDMKVLRNEDGPGNHASGGQEGSSPAKPTALGDLHKLQAPLDPGQWRAPKLA